MVDKEQPADRGHPAAHADVEEEETHSMWEELSRGTGIKVRRRIKARRGKRSKTWYAVGMLGLIGWSVVIPPLVGVALGAWIDSLSKGIISWTLILFLVGLGLGLWNAWQWLKQEGMKNENKDELEEGGN